MSDGLLNAFWRSLLSQSANVTTEVNNNEDEVCRRLILSAITVSAAGVISIPGLTIGTITVPGGGTGVVTLTNHGVLLGQGASNVVVTAPGTTGQVLTGVTGADPAFAALALTAAGFTNQGTTTTLLHGNAAGAASFAAVALTTDVSGTLPVANGGTGLTAGTSGGVLAYSAAGTLVSSAALAATALVVGGGAGVAPATNSNWTIASNILSSTTQPRAVVTNNTQSIPNAAFTALTFATEEDNVGPLHSTVTNPSRLTVPTGGDGTYLVTASLDWASSAAGNGRIARLRKNATTEIQRQSMGPTTAFLPAHVLVAQLKLVATDFLEFEAFQDSGGSLGTAGTNASRFAMVKLW